MTDGPPELANKLNRQTVEVSMQALFPQTLNILRNIERLEPLIIIRDVQQEIASPPEGVSEEQLAGLTRLLNTSVTLEVLVGDRRIAFNDDHGTDEPDLLATDAVIEGLEVEGPITIRVNSFNGVSEGEVAVTVDTRPAVPACQPEQIVAPRYVCMVQGGQTVSITARDESGGLVSPAGGA
ncbi:MAG: hypothetical protein HC910_21895 [Spirulinaceae cyanobacterium SM2_1_0]|nr:hypothetical protein [Spirulinaceae cyanobacterium SM2_1_0]